MPRPASRRRLPEPVRDSLTRLAGWGYWARRRLRRALGHAPAGLADGGSGPATASAALPVDATLPAGAPDSILARNQYGVYCVPRASEHRGVAQAILASRVWEAETLDLLRSSDPAGDIIHAGTYFGDFLPALAHSRSDGARVWAFEPGRENFRCSQITVELNGLLNVTLIQAGLGSAGGVAQLATGNREGVPLGGGSKILTNAARLRWWETEEVRLVAVDEVVPAGRRIAIVHLDLEGHEQQALTGALQTIARCRPP